MLVHLQERKSNEKEMKIKKERNGEKSLTSPTLLLLGTELSQQSQTETKS